MLLILKFNIYLFCCLSAFFSILNRYFCSYASYDRISWGEMFCTAAENRSRCCSGKYWSETARNTFFWFWQMQYSHILVAVGWISAGARRFVQLRGRKTGFPSRLAAAAAVGVALEAPCTLSAICISWISHLYFFFLPFIFPSVISNLLVLSLWFICPSVLGRWI